MEHENHMAPSTKAKKEHEAVMAKHPAGEGSRFAHLKAMMDRRGARNPAALAAWIGRRKFGKAGFQAMAARGRKKVGLAAALSR